MIHYEWQDLGTWGDEGPHPLDNIMLVPVDGYKRLLDINAEMLEALKDAAIYFKSDQLIRHPWDHPEESYVVTQLLEKMQAAIAKAEGQS